MAWLVLEPTGSWDEYREVPRRVFLSKEKAEDYAYECEWLVEEIPLED